MKISNLTSNVKWKEFDNDPLMRYYSLLICISEDFCQNNTEVLKLFQHPTNCKSFIQCEKSITYSLPCQTGDFCFGLESTKGCNECDRVTCQSTGLYTFI